MCVCQCCSSTLWAAIAGRQLGLGPAVQAMHVACLTINTWCWHSDVQYQWPVVIGMPPTLPGVFYSEFFWIPARCAAALLPAVPPAAQYMACRRRCPVSPFWPQLQSFPSCLSARQGSRTVRAASHCAMKRALRCTVGLGVLAPPPSTEPAAVQRAMVGCTPALAHGVQLTWWEHFPGSVQKRCAVCAVSLPLRHLLLRHLLCARRADGCRVPATDASTPQSQPLHRTFPKAPASAAAPSARA